MCITIKKVQPVIRELITKNGTWFKYIKDYENIFNFKSHSKTYFFLYVT